LKKYFLGANSSGGFYSLYGGFCRAEGDYLGIIKGGPGTGKSGFMRRIGQAAERCGLDVEYVLCSGDPVSLDGVYIPALHRGWADGTSPHAAEPNFLGVDGEYIDLSRFCALPLAKNDAEDAEKLYTGYKSSYKAAYSFLKAASEVGKIGRRELTEREKLEIKKIMSTILPRRKSRKSVGKEKFRFLRCLSCEGEITLNSELEENRVFTLFGGRRAADYALKYLTREALLRGFSPIVCLSPQNPEEYEAVIIPELETAVTDRHYSIRGAKSTALPVEEVIPCKYEEIEKTLIGSAYDCLAHAKKLHDELEEIYKKAMDFEALTEFTEEYTTKIFG